MDNNSKLKTETNKEYRGIIHSASLACEGLLSIIAELEDLELYEPKIKKNFGELQKVAKNFIVDNFGQDIYYDLNDIREYRNQADHPSEEDFTYIQTIKLLKKAELFITLFDIYFNRRITGQKY